MGSALVCPECDGELDVPQMSLGPGFVVGGFLIKHKLGEGGMGEVYLATQLSLERDVALKILPGRFTRERSFIVRFLKEVHYQARLDHPNVVAAFDAGEDSGVYYMAMAYVDGETLEERLDREGPLNEKAALQIIRQVGMALQYASEEKGLLHRDIKPGNIMVTPSQHAKVLDMGLSKNTLEKASSTMADTLLGTPNYMSPEQIDHPRDLDTRSDMFSLGMTLYHALTGQVPYEDTSYLKTLKRHASDELEDPRRLMPGISRHAVYFLARLLARDPDDRYPDWNSFQDDLREVMSGGHRPAPPEGASSLRIDRDLDSDPEPEPAETDAGFTVTEAKPTRRGIWISVLIGMAVGALSVVAFGLMFPRPEAPAPLPPVVVISPDPNPAPTAVPPVPTPVSPELQQELARLILEYESGELGFDPMISELVKLGQQAQGTVVAEEAARQIVQVRRDRDQALKRERNRVRQETLEILYDEGGEAARSYLESLESPFAEDLEEMIGNLGRRIRIVEQQKEEQRIEERTQAENRLQSRTREVAALILKRDGVAALELLDQAARDPNLFPVAEQVADLRQEVVNLQEIPHLVMAEFERMKDRPVVLQLQDRMIEVTIRSVGVEGLRVERPVTDEAGRPIGTVEQEVAFSQLNPNEVMRRLEPLETPAAEITRGLMAYRSGNQEKCREALFQAGTPLAEALLNQIFALPTLDMFDN